MGAVPAAEGQQSPSAVVFLGPGDGLGGVD
jgi:hypothetical protein